MKSRIDDQASDFEVIDRFESGIGWIAHPGETMERASHAIEIDGALWVIDPVDADGIDDLLAEFGPVAGVVCLVGRHKRDAAAVANRHEAPIYLPDWFDGVANELDAPIVRFGATLADTGIETISLHSNRFWQEVALFDPETDTLVVPESLGTAPYFVTGPERLGVHPMLRAFPPRDELGSFTPERVLVGHGSGVMADATGALRHALAGSRKRMPLLYWKTMRMALPL